MRSTWHRPGVENMEERVMLAVGLIGEPQMVAEDIRTGDDVTVTIPDFSIGAGNERLLVVFARHNRPLELADITVGGQPITPDIAAGEG